MLDFTAIDFETANSRRGSPCAVGLVRVRDGRIVDEQRWLIRPPREVDFFDSFNIGIHGITAADVADAPSWSDVVPLLTDYVGADLIAAHSAAFDTGVIRDACVIDGLQCPKMDFVCTRVLARRALSLPSYSLPFVLDALGLPPSKHHDPLDDSRAAAAILTALAATQGSRTVGQLAASLGVRVGHFATGIYMGSAAAGSGGPSRLETLHANPDADRDGALYGKVIVFTGELSSMTQQDAWQACADVGAVPKENTTGRTQILVIGGVDQERLQPGSRLSAEARKAFDLQAGGQDIEVMTEADFLACLGDYRAPVAAPTSRCTVRAATDVDSAPRPLIRHGRKTTTQQCSTDGCTHLAAFRTHGRSAWCDEHIAHIQREGGVEPLEPFTHPEDWQLTRCLACGIACHYRFAYTLKKNGYGEPTCRACFLRQWSHHARALQGAHADTRVVPAGEAEATAAAAGFDYLGPLTDPSLPDDPHYTRCRRCGKLAAQRLSDISFGCACRERRR